MEDLIRRPEQKKRLIDMMQELLDKDTLNDEDVVEILEICQRACKRSRAELQEDYLKVMIESEREEE